MEDGPKLLPQWLRGNSSLHNRGDPADSLKRAKPAAPADSGSRQTSQGADPWLSRAPSGPIGNGGLLTSSSSGKGTLDYGRVPDRGSQTERSWKPRSDSNGFTGAAHRSSYAAAPVKPGGGGARDERDAGILLKPAGSGSYSSARAYGRPVESEGGAGVAGGRLDRGHDGWAGARPLSGGGSVGLGPGGRADDGGRSPVRPGGPPNGISMGGPGRPSKAFFDKDFPSLRPANGGSGSPAAAVATATATVTSASSAPLAGAASSPLLDTASSGPLLTPYRQTFLSSRTSSNWTSKLAEAPVAPVQQQQQQLAAQQAQPTTPLAAWGDDDSRASPQPAAAAKPLSSAPSPPPLATPPAPPAPAPAVPPRPAGVWGTAPAAATVAGAAASGSEAANGGAGGGAGGAMSAASRARLEQLAVRQSKQLIPVVNAGGGKCKASGVGSAAGGAGAGSGGAAGGGRGSHVFAAPPKPGGPSTAGMLKITSSKGGEGVAAGPLVLTNNSVILSKKASQPLDRPLTLTLTRTASATAPAATAPSTGPAPEATAPGFAASPSAGNLAVFAGGGGSGGAGAGAPATGSTVQQHGIMTAPGSGSGIRSADAPLTAKPDFGPVFGTATPDHRPNQGQGQGLGPALQCQHPALTVTEEEEAFLRSLGWTGFDEDGEEGDTGLTEEEIAAFKAQPPAAVAVATAAAVAGAAVAAAAPKPVPAANPCRRGKPLIVAASYGSEQICSSTDSDSECE